MSELPPRPRVSFVIPVKDDADHLRHCLSSIAANTYPREAVEIIVGDNGSRDRSADMAADAGASVQHIAGCRVSAVRNRAAAAASGAVIAFVDSDHEIAPTWIVAAVEALAERRVGAVGALCRPPSDGTWVQRMYGVLRGRTLGRADVNWLGAGNMAVTSEAFRSVGGFDESLEACEDVDLCQRLRARGWRVIGDERLDNIHFGDPTTLQKLFKAERWRGRDNLRVTFRPGWTWRDLPSAVIPLAQAALLAGAVLSLLSSIWLGGGGVAVAALAAGLALCPSIARAIRMVASGHLRSGTAVAQAAVVALTFDMARAAALVGRAAHHRGPGALEAKLPA